jgi:hypothetical protein
MCLNISKLLFHHGKEKLKYISVTLVMLKTILWFTQDDFSEIEICDDFKRKGFEEIQHNTAALINLKHRPFEVDFLGITNRFTLKTLNGLLIDATIK